MATLFATFVALLFTPSFGIIDSFAQKHVQQASLLEVAVGHPQVMLNVHTSTADEQNVISKWLSSYMHAATISDYLWLRICEAAFVSTVGCVMYIYGDKGHWVVFRICVYIAALAAIKASVVLVQKQSAFQFPLFITGAHCLCGLLVAISCLAYQNGAASIASRAPSRRTFITGFLPVALAFAGGIALGNEALVYNTSAFTEIVQASSPIVTALVGLAMQQPFDLKLMLPCILVFLGCTMSTQGETHFSLLGFALAFGSNVPRALKTVLQTVLLRTGTSGEVYTPMEVLAWTCLPSWVGMMVWSLLQEGLAPYHQWHTQGFFSHLTGHFLVSCVCACILNVSILFVLQDLGAVGTQIVAQAKTLLVVLAGACFLKEKVTVMEFIGFAIIMVGVYVYNKVESEVVAEQKNKPDVNVNVQSTGASLSQQDPFLIEDQTVEGAEDEIIAV
jgi:drug/metabolite transporter (DMT)-like permease